MDSGQIESNFSSVILGLLSLYPRKDQRYQECSPNYTQARQRPIGLDENWLECRHLRALLSFSYNDNTRGNHTQVQAEIDETIAQTDRRRDGEVEDGLR